MKIFKKYLSIALVTALAASFVPVFSAQDGEIQVPTQVTEVPVQNNSFVSNARWYNNITAQKVALCAAYTGMALIAIYCVRKEYLSDIIRAEKREKFFAHVFLADDLYGKWLEWLPFIELLSKEQQEGCRQEWITAMNKMFAVETFSPGTKGLDIIVHLPKYPYWS